MSKTKIEWTRGDDGNPGYTWNPVRGCSRCSPGCLHCYAERMAARNLPGMKSPTTGEPFAIINGNGPHWTGKVELIPSMLDVPLKRRKPTTWFVNSMSDIFHEALSFNEIRRVHLTMIDASWHTFMVLTKRSARMAEYFDWLLREGSGRVDNAPGNIWLGVSVESRDYLSRIDDLRRTPAVVRFLSLEPLLEDLGTLDLTGISWCIVGGESGPGARPCELSWMQSIVKQCQAAKVPVFVKQIGSNPYWKEYEMGRARPGDRKGGDMSEWPEDLRVREMPIKL